MHDFQIGHSISTENPPAPAREPAAVKAKKSERILVMDDEPPILELTVRLLKSRGYEVETAMDGGMAVNQYRLALDAGRRFDLVILDLTVPEKMGGYEAFEAIKALDPTVKAIVSSGYSHEPVVLRYKDYGIAGVAPKPYRVSELLGAVEGVLLG
jgi:CheY-like chemotaxis protein